MGFAGPSVSQTGVWDDYRASTSLGSSLLRLVGGGLSDIGAIQRKERERAADRALKEADDARQSSQFDRTLAQRQLEHGDEVSRWDADRLAKRKDDARLFSVDDKGFITADPEEASPRAFIGGVPAMRARGAEVQATQPAAPDLPTAPPDDFVRDNMRRGLTAADAGAAWTNKPVEFVPEKPAAAAPASPVRPAFRGTRQEVEMFLRNEERGKTNKEQAEVAQTKADAKTNADAADVEIGRMLADPSYVPDQKAWAAMLKDPRALSVASLAQDRTEKRAFKSEQEKAKAADAVNESAAFKAVLESRANNRALTEAERELVAHSRFAAVAAERASEGNANRTATGDRANRRERSRMNAQAREAALTIAEKDEQDAKEALAELMKVKANDFPDQATLEKQPDYVKAKKRWTDAVTATGVARVGHLKALEGAVRDLSDDEEEPSFASAEEANAAFVAEAERLKLKPGSKQRKDLGAKYAARVK